MPPDTSLSDIRCTFFSLPERTVTHRQFFSESRQIKPKSDCRYHFSSDLTPNGILFCFILIEKMVRSLQCDFGLVHQDSEKIVCLIVDSLCDSEINSENEFRN